MDQQTRKLYRSRTDRVIGGVAGGLAHYFKIDPVVVRVVFILLALASGVGILLYIAMLIVVPEAPVHGGEHENVIEGEFSKEEFKEKMKNFGEEMKSWGEDMKHQHHHNRGRGWFGLILVLIGAFLLVNQLVPNYFRWDIFWPALIVLVGLLFIFRSGRR